MSLEVILLIVLAGITLLAYMIAVNSHGLTRLSISYCIATVILAGTVWVTVQYVNNDQNVKNRNELNRLELEKQKAEDQMRSREQQYESEKKENKTRLGLAGKLTTIVTSGIGLAVQMINTNVRDQNLEIDALIGRAAATRRSCDELAADFGKVAITDNAFSESANLIQESLKLLSEAAQYYSLYFKAEDSAQEELRERIMRQKARSAQESLQKAGSLIALLNSQ
jgi:hypothetical protein